MRLIGEKTDTLFERIRKRVVAGPNGCWIWTGAKAGKGYGHTRLGNGMVLVHRVALEEKLGRPIKTGFHALHACDEMRCCNPSHIWEGTNYDNIKDRMAKGRSILGERNHRSKLTDETVRQIRSLRGKMLHREIGEIVGVTQTNVSRVLRGELWAHVK